MQIPIDYYLRIRIKSKKNCDAFHKRTFYILLKTLVKTVDLEQYSIYTPKDFFKKSRK